MSAPNRKPDKNDTALASGRSSVKPSQALKSAGIRRQDALRRVKAQPKFICPPAKNRLVTVSPDETAYKQ